MAKGRVKKEVMEEVCNWVLTQAKKLQAKGTDASGTPLTEEAAVQAAVDMASEHFGYRAPTIGGWLGGGQKPAKAAAKGKKRPGRPKKKAAKAAKAAEAAEAAEAEPTPVKRRRGRPRKSVAAPKAVAKTSLADEAFAIIGELVLAKDGLGTLDRDVLIAVGKRHLEWRAKDQELAELRKRSRKG